MLNGVKAGSSVPIKFSLADKPGIGAIAPGYPKSAPMTCGATQPIDDLEDTAAAGSSGWSYNNGEYQYNWKTETSWTGCRQFTLKLPDGTLKTANFKFKK